MAKSKDVQCPKCKNSFDLEDECDWFEAESGDTVYCPECDVKLEIVSIDPPKIAIAVKKDGDESDDWEEDDEDEDDVDEEHDAYFEDEDDD